MISKEDWIAAGGNPQEYIEQTLKPNSQIKLAELPEFAVEEMQGQRESVAPAHGIGLDGKCYDCDKLDIIYEQNKQILRHIDGIEKAFNEVAKLTSETLGEFANSSMGNMLGKLMGRG